MPTLELEPPLLVFGGPYSNLRALEAMRSEARRLGIPASRTLCTGDVVAYCAEPEESIAFVRDWGIHVVQGNCEEQLGASAGDCGCGFVEDSACDRLAKSWYEHADRVVSRASRAWMAALPKTIELTIGDLRALAVHGTARQINRFVFASQRQVIAEELAATSASLVIAGHCGIPFIARSAGKVWLNPGVIGMPANDGTPDGWYGLVMVTHDGALRLSTHRLAHDHAGAARSLRSAHYADAYAEALETGLWPSLDVLPPAERAATGRPLQELTVSLPIDNRQHEAHA
jgi:predicted phosphodiesterase